MPELRAKTIGQMQMQYQMRNREGGNFVLDIQKPRGGNVSFGTRLELSVAGGAQFPMMSAQSMWEQVTVNRLMLGNGFIYIERNDWTSPCACGWQSAAVTTSAPTHLHHHLHG